MKRIIALVLAIALALCMSAAAALAATAQPNQKLAFRTGPNTRYAEMFTLPQDTPITPIEIEAGNGVDWVLCEFSYGGETYHGYTGIKRMSVSGDLYRANHALVSGCMNSACTVYAAPDSNAAVRGKVGRHEMVSYLRTEGCYDYIEFYDSSAKAPSRGWVDTHQVFVSYEPDQEFSAAYITEAGNVYADAASGSSSIGRVGKYEMVGYMDSCNGYDRIMFYSAASGERTVGYVPSHIVDAYGQK